VTEVCAFYQRTFTVTGPDGPMPPKQWVRHEWTRSGLSLQRNGSHLAWVITAYLLTTAVSTPLWGKLGDQYGSKIFFSCVLTRVTHGVR